VGRGAEPGGLCGAGTHWERTPVPTRERKPQAPRERLARLAPKGTGLPRHTTAVDSSAKSAENLRRCRFASTNPSCKNRPFSSGRSPQPRIRCAASWAAVLHRSNRHTSLPLAPLVYMEPPFCCRTRHLAASDSRYALDAKGGAGLTMCATLVGRGAEPGGLCGAGTHWERMPVPIRAGAACAMASLAPKGAGLTTALGGTT
jgi:hypothetical protein